MNFLKKNPNAPLHAKLYASQVSPTKQTTEHNHPYCQTSCINSVVIAVVDMCVKLWLKYITMNLQALRFLSFNDNLKDLIPRNPECINVIVDLLESSNSGIITHHY